MRTWRALPDAAVTHEGVFGENNWEDALTIPRSRRYRWTERPCSNDIVPPAVW